jgi:nucleotide-binding universal stress UspA family protein
VGRLERARSAAKAIIAEADARDAEIIVVGSPRRRLTGSQAAVFGKTVDYVLKRVRRVLVTATEAS